MVPSCVVRPAMAQSSQCDESTAERTDLSLSRCLLPFSLECFCYGEHLRKILALASACLEHVLLVRISHDDMVARARYEFSGALLRTTHASLGLFNIAMVPWMIKVDDGAILPEVQ